MMATLYVTKVKRPRKYASRHRPGSACCAPLVPAVDPWEGSPLVRDPEFLRWFA
jgi:hypothetical protein